MWDNYWNTEIISKTASCETIIQTQRSFQRQLYVRQLLKYSDHFKNSFVWDKFHFEIPFFYFVCKFHQAEDRSANSTRTTPKTIEIASVNAMATNPIKSVNCPSMRNKYGKGNKKFPTQTRTVCFYHSFIKSKFHLCWIAREVSSFHDFSVLLIRIKNYNFDITVKYLFFLYFLVIHCT